MVFSFTYIRSTRGSALLISLLIMSFLVVFGFGISRVIIDALRVERNVVEAGKSYFAAESGVELALYYRENHLPGYEVQQDDGVTIPLILSNGAQVDYRMTAQGTEVPCAHRDEWRPLQLQESVSLPLYRWDADDASGRVEIHQFTVSYEVDRGDAYGFVNGDVLRWKILGIDKSGGHTEAISGLLSYDAANNVLSSSDGASFYDGQSGGTFVHYDSYSILSFLENHSFNTLILTNVLALNAQDPSVQSAEQNVLKVKLSTASDLGQTEATACEYTLIESDGTSGETSQNIDVQVKLDSFLPVFDFALFNTDSL